MAALEGGRGYSEFASPISSNQHSRSVHTHPCYVLTIIMSKKRKREEGQHTIEVKDYSPSQWNFTTDYNDHFETPSLAYADILDVLKEYASSIGKTLSSLVIYDPYFCLGSMKAILQSLGASKVINENKDFYGMIQSKSIPGILDRYSILLRKDISQSIYLRLRYSPDKPTLFWRT